MKYRRGELSLVSYGKENGKRTGHQKLKKKEIKTTTTTEGKNKTEKRKNGGNKK